MPRPKKSLPIQSTTGASASKLTVKETVAAAKTVVAAVPVAPSRPAHQTHGAFTPISGPVTNVSQLTNGGRNTAKGSAGSFTSMDEYGDYLRGLSTADLHSHAVNDARLVPIDDRDRLIKRLETAWTATAARYPGRAAHQPIPSRQPFSREQVEAQEAIRRSLIRR